VQIFVNPHYALEFCIEDWKYNKISVFGDFGIASLW